ncbi:MAG: quinolinate synthase NadA [Anaerolineae bacterium]|nr:quinolinate synthase NadA [Anaerolineae bacterium]
MPITVETLLTAATPLIKLALAEDIGPGDATSQSTLDAVAPLHGRVVAKAPGVIAGLPVAEAVFHAVDPALAFTAHVCDGQEVVAGELIAEVKGPGPSLLAAERTALNFLQRMSGIATATRDFVDAVATTRAIILDTRKTLPGYRILDKYAVSMGGAQNHRMALFDMLMVKDNHTDGAGSITAAVTRARAAHPNLPIEVEVRTLAELQEALAIKPPLDRIMLDNMDLETMQQAVRLTAGRVPLEASGNVTLKTVAAIAETGVDFISTGAITHSVIALDLSMKITKPTTAPTLSWEERARRAKAALGDRLVILGHHYQRDEVIQFADFRGDSLQLARDAAQTDAEHIVFCGVYFMAEVAAILAKPGQHVYIPNSAAGCYLADTAERSQVEQAWLDLDAALVGQADAEITPITYVNSDAALKAFCGKHGGSVCTSGNAAKVLIWAFAQRPRVFFFPDQHLGRNTARALGIPGRPAEEILLWTPHRPPSAEAIRRAKVVLWPGACNVHQRFHPSDIAAVRARHPGIRVIVHPECDRSVVELADSAGSTTHIIKEIEGAPAGSAWAVGTETHLVLRLQREHPEQLIVSLAERPPYCSGMGAITLRNLTETLEALARGEFPQQVTVEAETAQWARVALERMLKL